MDYWQLQEAKNKLSQVIDKAVQKGPQTITRHGKATVVVVSIDDYEKKLSKKNSFVDFLLQSPLHQSGLEIERPFDTGRELDL